MLYKSSEEYFDIMSKIVTKLATEVGMDNTAISEMLGITIMEVAELNLKKGTIN